MQVTETTTFAALLADVRRIIETAQREAIAVAGQTMTLAYWDIGARIEAARLADEQTTRQTYIRLSYELTTEFGAGYKYETLREFHLFYRAYPERDAIKPGLMWSHWAELMRVAEPLRGQLEAQARANGWTCRQLIREVAAAQGRSTWANDKMVTIRENVLQEFLTGPTPQPPAPQSTVLNWQPDPPFPIVARPKPVQPTGSPSQIEARQEHAIARPAVLAERNKVALDVLDSVFNGPGGTSVELLRLAALLALSAAPVTAPRQRLHEMITASETISDLVGQLCDLADCLLNLDDERRRVIVPAAINDWVQDQWHLDEQIATAQAKAGLIVVRQKAGAA